MATCDTQEILSDASCFSCYPPGQLELMRMVILCRMLNALNPMANCSPSSLLESAACFACHTTGELAIINTQLLCDIREAIGNGQQTCLLCGTDDPSETPACNCALYYKVLPDLNLELWYWDADTTQWIQTIGGPA